MKRKTRKLGIKTKILLAASTVVAVLIGVQGYTSYQQIEENMLDPTTDYRDDGHLNVFGAQKVTAFMGNYISERYDIPDRSEDTFYKEKWNGDYQEYLAYVTEQIENSEG